MANVARTIENLQKRGYHVNRFPTKQAAADYIVETVGDHTVGMGGSVSLVELDVYDRLCARGETLWHMFTNEPGMKEKATKAPVYMMSANGISESGQIINIDGLGNRVAMMCYGPKRLLIVIGINKIAPDDTTALWRARNIASPKNCRRLSKKTPCSVGEITCHDCNSPDRICRIFVTLERPPIGMDVDVIIVDEALGF